jgi:prepilin peptidase CpaA
VSHDAQILLDHVGAAALHQYPTPAGRVWPVETAMLPAVGRLPNRQSRCGGQAGGKLISHVEAVVTFSQGLPSSVGRMGGSVLSLGLAAVLAILLLAAGIEDARRRTISNWTNLAVASLAPAWWWSQGYTLWPDVAWQLLLATVVFAVFASVFAIGAMGGGDVKLIAALALWLPLQPMVSLLMVMSIAGGVVTLLMMADRRLRRAGGILEVPYGVAIAFAGLLALREPLINQFT